MQTVISELTSTLMIGSSQVTGDGKKGAASKPETVMPTDSATTDVVKLFPYEMALSLYKGLLGEARNKLANGEITVS